VAPAPQRNKEVPAISHEEDGSRKLERVQPAHCQTGQLPVAKQPATVEVIEPDSELLLQPDFLASDAFEVAAAESDEPAGDSASVEDLLLSADDPTDSFDSAAANIDVPTLTDSVSKAREFPGSTSNDYAELPELDSVVDSIAFDLGRIVHADELGPDQSDEGPDTPLAADAERTEMLEALANAKVLEDISNSMAETLFGDDELEKLAATLAVHTGEAGAATDEAEEQDDGFDALAATGLFRR
jgi:hypothetical protein